MVAVPPTTHRNINKPIPAQLPGNVEKKRCSRHSLDVGVRRSNDPKKEYRVRLCSESLKVGMPEYHYRVTR